MKRAIVEGMSYAPVDDIYGFFMDFENYVKYSEYVDDIRVLEDGDHPEWELDFKWWIIRYTTRSKLIDYEENDYIEWEVTKDVDIKGRWEFDEVDDEETAVRLEIMYDPKGASKVNPIGFLPTERLIQVARPVADRHVSKVLRRVAEEVEVEPRDVDYTIRPGGVEDEDEFLALVPEERLEDTVEDTTR
jgi:ribosome-associated toxin RatA of RatAB toxin-antitoxin module